MGYKKHVTLKCHTCKCRKAVGGTKSGGSWGTQDGWTLDKIKNGWAMFCPACSRKKVK